MHFLTLFTAKYLIAIIVLVAFAYWLTVPRKEKIRLAIFGLITAVVAFALAKIGSALYFDPRPFVSHHVTPIYPHGPDNGFPSDHTLLSAVTALTVFSSSKRIGTFLMVLAVAVGAARVAGHIHSPIDIIGSIVFAAAGYVAAVWLTPHAQKYLQKTENR